MKTRSLISKTRIDDYAKMVDWERSDIYAVFTKILCSGNFYVW